MSKIKDVWIQPIIELEVWILNILIHGIRFKKINLKGNEWVLF